MSPEDPSVSDPSTSDAAADEASIEIPLTAEQQAFIHKMTGEHATVLELAPNPGTAASGTGRGFRFKWRLSITSGIPRQSWGKGHTAELPVPDQGSSA